MIGRAGRNHGESGETLIEILISVAIMGVVMVGLLSGLTTATVAGDTHRKLTDVEVVAREYGEALVARAATPLSTQLTDTAEVGSSSLKVSSIAGFTKGMSMSVDGEVAVIKDPPAGTTIVLTEKLVAKHAVASAVTVYEPCPGPSSFTVPGFTTTASGIESPTVSLVEYFAQPADATAIPVEVAEWTGVGAPPSACINHWFTAGLPCSKYEDTTAAPRPHLVGCDLPLLRVSLIVRSTDVPGSARGAETATQVLINRGNA